MTHPQVAKVAFTGGDAPAASVYAVAAGLKRVTLELGGKSPNIVFADADSRMPSRRGLRHLRRHRPDLHRRLAPPCAALDPRRVPRRLVAIAEPPGRRSPRDQTQIGPITTSPSTSKVLEYIDVARGEGATARWAAVRPPWRGSWRGLVRRAHDLRRRD